MRLLKKLYCISSPSGKEKQMRKFILNYCKKNGAETYVDKSGNVYVTKGVAESYPCIVAHMDEVCPDRGCGYTVLDSNGVLVGFDLNERKYSGIGGDDKNGIWVALRCIEKYSQIKCVFFTQEEIGCIGSEAADMDFFSDCRYVLQCDRRGSSDLISSVYRMSLCSDEFLNDINYQSFGYATTSGMLTDVYTLKENGLEVSCVNISCGYYDPHSDREFTIVSDLMNCLAFVENIIENCLGVYPHIAEYNQGGKYNYPDWYNNDDIYYNDYDAYVNEYEDAEQIICEGIEDIKTIPENELDIIAKIFIQENSYKHLSTSDVIELIKFYREY